MRNKSDEDLIRCIRGAGARGDANDAWKEMWRRMLRYAYGVAHGVNLGSKGRTDEAVSDRFSKTLLDTVRGFRFEDGKKYKSYFGISMKNALLKWIDENPPLPSIDQIAEPVSDSAETKRILGEVLAFVDSDGEKWALKDLLCPSSIDDRRVPPSLCSKYFGYRVLSKENLVLSGATRAVVRETSQQSVLGTYLLYRTLDTDFERGIQLLDAEHGP